MRKLSIVMTALFCAGAAGIVWADDLNPQPLPPGVNSAGGNGGTQTRKAGGEQENLTLHDQSQIQGNLQGDGNNGGLGKSGESKIKSHSSGGGAGKTKNTGNSVKGPTSGNGGMQKRNKGKGESKFKSRKSGGGAGKTKITGNGLGKVDTFHKQNSFSKPNGMSKPGMGAGSALPAVQTAH